MMFKDEYFFDPGEEIEQKVFPPSGMSALQPLQADSA